MVALIMSLGIIFMLGIIVGSFALFTSTSKGIKAVGVVILLVTGLIVFSPSDNREIIQSAWKDYNSESKYNVGLSSATTIKRTTTTSSNIPNPLITPDEIPPHLSTTPSPTVCRDGDTRDAICPDGVTTYLNENCVDGKWHQVMYIRNPCEALPTTTTLPPSTTPVLSSKNSESLESILSLPMLVANISPVAIAIPLAIDSNSSRSTTNSSSSSTTTTTSSTTTTSISKTSKLKYVCTSNYYNCGDFSSYSMAKEVFDACGGIKNDIHGLDGDNDGIPCDSLK